jgi:hypothetical protein
MFRFNEIEKTLPTKSGLNNLAENCYYSTIIQADWGEGLLPVIIENESELIRNFGEMTDNNYKEYHQAKNFFKYSTQFKPIRIVNSECYNKQNDYIDNNPPDNTEIENFYNTEIADIDDIVTTRIGIVEKFINTNEDISIAICSSLSAWDKEISYEKLNLVQSKTVTEPPESPMNNDMYLLPAHSTGDWSGHDGEYAIWLHENEAWNFVSVLATDTIYVRDENKEYDRVSGNWIEQEEYYSQFEHIKYKNESAYRIVYEEPYQNSFGKVIKYNQLVLQRPNFTDGDFVILIFQKQKINNKFRLVERFVTNYSTAETDINFVSKFIYIKIEEGTEDLENLNAIDTYNYSIVQSRLKHDTNTNESLRLDDYEMAIGTIVEDDQIQIVSDVEYSSSMNLFSSIMAELQSKKILVSGCYDNTRYSSITDIIDDFGLFRTDPYYNTIKYSNTFIIASMIFENDYRKYVPLYGEVVGTIVNNLSNYNFINAGQYYGQIINKSKLLLRSNETVNTELHQNYINNVSFDNDTKYNYITNDVMLNETNINVGYTLMFNIVEQYINTFFTAYGLSCPRTKELEKLKNILSHKITDHGLESTITYSVNNETNTITYSVILKYKTIIKEIIVNFIIT